MIANTKLSMCFLISTSISICAHSQENTIRTELRQMEPGGKVTDSVLIYVPCQPDTGTAIVLNGRKWFPSDNEDTDSIALRCSVLKKNVMQVFSGNKKSRSIFFSNRHALIYICMTDAGCEVYLANKRMIWERWTE